MMWRASSEAVTSPGASTAVPLTAFFERKKRQMRTLQMMTCHSVKFAEAVQLFRIVAVVTTPGSLLRWWSRVGALRSAKQASARGCLFVGEVIAA